MKRHAQFDDELPPEGGDPLSVESFSSLEDLKDRLVQMGPDPTTYERVFELVGPENEDEAKSALADFFGGSPTALCFLYRLLVRLGKANAIDDELVAEVTQMHPELIPEEEREEGAEEKTSGLFLPDKIKKTASGYLGGPNPGNSYMVDGPEQTRFCPKLRQLTSTFVCRYHCLDGMTIDDAETVCAEAIWRQSVMDKFTREFKDNDGNWVGGYIRGRFLVEQNTEGNDYQLKPGERVRPIKENAWSTEKRLVEMRRQEGDERGYKGVYEPEDLYEFDQHGLAEGPKNVQLDAKGRDSIAKNASSSREVKNAQSMWEGSDDPFVRDMGRESIEETAPRTYGDLEEIADEDFSPDDPSEGDITTTDFQNWYQYDRLFHHGSEESLKDKLDEQDFRPKIWFISDHGQPQLVSEDIYGGMNPLASNDGKKVFNLKKAKGKPASTPAKKTFNLRRAKSKEVERAKEWDPNPWAVCTDSVGREDKEKYERCVQQVKEKQKKSFNLHHVKEAAELGAPSGGRDVMSPPDASPSASVCVECGQKFAYKAGQKACPTCGGKLVNKSSSELSFESGAIKNPSAWASLEPRMTHANGVYKAYLGKLAGFGDTPEQARDNLAEMTTQTIDQQSEEIREILEEDQPEDVAPEPKPLPQEGTEETSADQDQGPHIDASDLEQDLLKGVAERDPNEQEELDDTAESLGL